jgi:cytosine/adenosine deaminase-related metal-dependent hydrolase
MAVTPTHHIEKLTLLKGGNVISLAADHPDAFVGDVLIGDDRILAIGESLGAGGADVIDVTGRIIMPGLVNAHLHTWQTGLRGACSDWALGDYLRIMHGVIAPAFTPEDVRVATLAGALNQLACGTTTLGDWCHNNPTPAHTDAAIEGLQTSGIRARFLHGTPKPQARPGAPHFSEIAHSRTEIERLARGPLADHAAPVTLGMAILGPHFSTSDVSVQDIRLAKEWDLVASMHVSGASPIDRQAWTAVEQAGLFGPRLNLVHANHLADDLLARLVAAGASFTSTPEVELGMGHGEPIATRLLRLGALPSLGVDVESVISGEMLTVARFARAQQRAAANAALGSAAPSDMGGPASSLQALMWATLGGARALGLDDHVGRLAPGYQADIVLVDTRALNLTPVHDPVATALQATPANIEAVMVNGQWRKLGGKLLAQNVDDLLDSLTASGRRLLAAR